MNIVRLTQDANLLAPVSVHWEIENALAAMIKRKRLTVLEARKAIKSYEKIPIRFMEVGLEESVAIASKYNLYAYDAYVIACAQSERCKLISLDSTLLHAAIAAGVGIKEYTFSKARQRLASLLDLARRDGAVRIRKRDGQRFILQPEKQTRSPLDVPGVKLNIKREEIVETIRSSRRPIVEK